MSRIRYRNAGKAGAAAAGITSRPAPTDAPPGRARLDRARAAGASAGLRETWVDWLAPSFTGNDSAYFTGTYSDDYGLPNGLMVVRNVHKDFAKWLKSFGFEGQYIVGVEEHAFRDVLHLHAILEGPFTVEQLRWIRRWWSVDRGHARALPVLDGCASYVTKYALKGDCTAFEWRLSR